MENQKNPSGPREPKSLKSPNVTLATNDSPPGPSTGHSLQSCGSEVPQTPTTSQALKPSATPQIARNKSKQSSLSARPREMTNITNFETLFGQKNFTKYYSIKSNGEANLAKMNMFKVDKEITKYIGVCEKNTEDFQSKSWTVEVKTSEQGNKLLTMTNLLGETVEVTPHEYHNSSQGVITCALLKGYSDDDIVEGLGDRGVIGCRRIIRGPKSPHPEPTTTLILTFNTPNPPDRLVIRTGLTERVRLYIPLPRRCYNCQRYGHSGIKCRKPTPVCIRCGEDMEEGHNPENCLSPVNCPHCHEPHSVTSKTCKKYILEKEILAIKTKEHLTFAEARAKMNLTFGTTQTYSAAVTKPRIPSDRRQHPVDYNNNDNDNNRSRTIFYQKHEQNVIDQPPKSTNLTVPVDVHLPPEDMELSSNASTVYSDARDTEYISPSPIIEMRSRKDSVGRHQRTCSTSRTGDSSRKRTLSGPIEMNEKRPNLTKPPIPDWVPNFLPKEQNKNSYKPNDKNKEKNTRKSDRVTRDS